MLRGSITRPISNNSAKLNSIQDTEAGPENAIILIPPLHTIHQVICLKLGWEIHPLQRFLTGSQIRELQRKSWWKHIKHFGDKRATYFRCLWDGWESILWKYLGLSHESATITLFPEMNLRWVNKSCCSEDWGQWL